MEDQNKLTNAQQDTLIQRLVKNFDAAMQSIINFNVLKAKSFITELFTSPYNVPLVNSPRRQEISVTSKGIAIYNNTGNLTGFYSNDFTNVDPNDPTVTIGSIGWLTNIISSLTTALVLQSKNGKCVVNISGGGSAGFFTVTLDNGVQLKVDSSGLVLTAASIFLEDARKVGTLNSFIRFREGTTNAIFLQAAGGSIVKITATDFTLPTGIDLNLGNSYVNDAAIVADGYVTLKDDTGTSYQVLVRS